MSDDSHTWECPECTKKNPVGIKKCKLCGYIQTKEDTLKNKGITIDPRYCAYVSPNTKRQCPLPGTLSTHINRTEKWYCAGHYKKHYGPDAELVYEDAVEYTREILMKKREVL